MASEVAERGTDPAAPRAPARTLAATPRGRLAGLLALLPCALAACGPASDAPSETESRPRVSLWRISSPDAPDGPAAHVLAAVAVHDRTRVRFDSAIEEAFARSARLVLPDDSALAPQAAIAGWSAHLAEGDALARWIGPTLHAAYTEAIGRGGFPAGTAEVTAPWFAARVVTGADYARTDFVSPDEISAQLAHRARERKPSAEVTPLEPSTATYERRGALSREEQAALMEIALARSARADERLPAIQAAWQRGDAEALAAQLGEGVSSDPTRLAAHRATVVADAERLARDLARSLEPAAHAQEAFWILPAELVVGERGVLARLERSGLRVEQRSSLDGNGTLRAEEPRSIPPLPPVAAPDPARRRILIVGIDGASLRVIEPLLERRRLPALASLAEAGASGPLRAHQPIYSPRIWTSIATGKSPEHHGIEGFTFRDAAGEQQLYLSHHRKAHALWNVFSDAGLGVGVVNWWNTYPPEIVRGVMISDHAVPSRLDDLETAAAARPAAGASQAAGAPPAAGASQAAGAPPSAGAPPAGGAGPASNGARHTVYPVDWLERVVVALEESAPLSPIEDPFAGVVGIPPFMHRERLSRRYADDAAITRMALDVDRAQTPDLLMVFLPGIDRVSHRLWGALEPPELYGPNLRLTGSQRATVRLALERYYEFTDSLIGLLIARFDANDLVLVMSDHGFEGGEHLSELTGVHDGEAALDGVLFARGPGIAPGATTDGTSVDDITPTVLAWRGLPLARDFDGSVAAFVAPPVPQPERVASYDGGVIERLDPAASGSEEEILERLRALGYIE